MTLGRDFDVDAVDLVDLSCDDNVVALVDVAGVFPSVAFGDFVAVPPAVT